MLGIAWGWAAFPALGAEVEASGGVRGAALSTPNAVLRSQISSRSDLVVDVVDRRQNGQGTSEAFGVLLDARAGVSARIVPALGGRIGLDTGLMDFDAQSGVFGDGRPIEAHLRRTLLLGETYLDLQPRPDGSLVLRLGKLQTSIADGVVFSGQALGASLDLDLRYQAARRPLKLVAFVGLPDGGFKDVLTSPLFHGALTWFRGEHRLSLSQTVLVDTSSALLPLLFGPSLASDLAETPNRTLAPEASRGWISWSGLEWRWEGEHLGIAMIGVLATGRETLEGQRRPEGRLRTVADSVGFDLLSGFGKIEGQARWDPGPGQMAVRPFVLAASGARDLGAPVGRRWTAFPSLAPLVPLTRFFLGAATLPAQQTPVLQSLSPDGAGLLGVGLAWEWILGVWGVRTTGAHFRSFAPSAPDVLNARFTGVPEPAARTYGTEVDLELSCFFADWAYASAEAAVFATGDFFGQAPAGWQALMGLNVLWDGPSQLP